VSQFADDAVVIVESYAGVDGIVHWNLLRLIFTLD
jgi:hypothetical protein